MKEVSFLVYTLLKCIIFSWHVVSERCPAGKFYDEEAGLCRSCGHGFFQPSEGSFKCLLCGLGKTTRTSEAVSQEVTKSIQLTSVEDILEIAN